MHRVIQRVCRRHLVAVCITLHLVATALASILGNELKDYVGAQFYCLQHGCMSLLTATK